MRSKSLFLLALIIAFAVPASAHNITIVDPFACYEYSLYTSDGILVGEYTANDTLYLDSPQDYRIFVKPSGIDIAKDPLVVVDWIKAYLPVVLCLGLVFVVIVCFVLIGRRGTR